MLRKLFVFLFCFLSFAPVFADSSSCTYDGNGSTAIGNSLSNCIPDGSVTMDGEDYKIASGVKAKVVTITNRIILAGSLLSVGGIVYASVLYVTALGADDKIKHAKESLKYAIIGFAVMLISFPLVNAVINLIYSLN